MIGQELKILFKTNLAFLVEGVALDFTQVELPNRLAKFKAPAFWTIRVINHIEKERKLFVEVIDYQVGETEFSDYQIKFANILMEIRKVTFNKIDTSALLKTQNSAERTKILPPKVETVYRGERAYIRENPIQPEMKTETEAITQIYVEPFSIPIKNVTFLAGRVAFEKKIQDLNKLVEFQIYNENIIKEYDAIKNYISNVLETKAIQVTPSITIVNGVITSINARSREIEKIDREFIEELKFKFVNIARRKESLGDEQLFTMDEYLDAFLGPDFKEQLLFKDDNDFFATLLEKSETKHYKQLRFLSSKHKWDLQKLRFVHKPFSFVFLLSSNDYFYIVWETLDTQEATYIWTYNSDTKALRQILIETEKKINLILSEGKHLYINRNEEKFNRVFHDYSDLQNGFKNWKDLIEGIIL